MKHDHPRIREVVYVAPQPEWSFPLHKHESSAELSLIRAGRGMFYCEGRRRIIGKGMLVAKNPNVSHSEKSDPEAPLEQICIEIDDIHTEGLAENCVIPQDADPVIECGELFDLLCACFEFLMGHYRSRGSEELCGRVLETVLAAITALDAGRAPDDSAVRRREKLIPDVIGYLDLHYTEKIIIRDLADSFYVSEGNLSRQFKKHTGFTINGYIVSKRMGEAQRRLIYADDDIKDIARGCGYEDIQYFYHVFKNYAKCTPKEFREKYRN